MDGDSRPPDPLAPGRAEHHRIETPDRGPSGECSFRLPQLSVPQSDPSASDIIYHAALARTALLALLRTA